MAVCLSVQLNGPHMQAARGDLFFGGSEEAYQRHELPHRQAWGNGNV